MARGFDPNRPHPSRDSLAGLIVYLYDSRESMKSLRHFADKLSCSRKIITAVLNEYRPEYEEVFLEQRASDPPPDTIIGQILHDYDTNWGPINEIRLRVLGASKSIIRRALYRYRPDFTFRIMSEEAELNGTADDLVSEYRSRRWKTTYQFADYMNMSRRKLRAIFYKRMPNRYVRWEEYRKGCTKEAKRKSKTKPAVEGRNAV